MNFLWFTFINNAIAQLNAHIAIPATILFFAASIILTIKNKFPQFTGLPHFLKILTEGFAKKKHTNAQGELKTMSSLQALATAMAGTIGMGNVVGPSVAIMLGGPGALFWMIVYIFFASVTKFTEVTFAMATRITTQGGNLVGGPMEYLKLVSPILGNWYVVVTAFLFMGWSSLQSNTLAAILEQEQIPAVCVGLFLALIVIVVLQGGIQRIGNVASKLVPVMFVLYFIFSAAILLQNPASLWWAIGLVFTHAFGSEGLFGGLLGVTTMRAMQAGIYKGVFVTEAGLGTSSIAHAVSDAKYPVDQGLLALFSMVSDALLCSLSGLIVLVTGVCNTGSFRSTLIYEAFKLNAPWYGKYVLIMSITLFVLTTVIGNSFNGSQCFRAFARPYYVQWYIHITGMVIFLGALLPVQFMWNFIDILLACVAIPNVIGLVILAFKKPEVLKIPIR
jgi:alanine or glycine:cation symporter, AGCS family